MTDKFSNSTRGCTGQFCVVTLTGCIDSTNADKFSDMLDQLINSNRRHLLLDCSHLSHITSAGLRALLIASDSAEENGGSLSLCNIDDVVYELLEMGGMLNIFTIYSSRAIALNRLVADSTDEFLQVDNQEPHFQIKIG